MRKKLGLLFILFSFLITFIFWSMASPTRTIPLVTQYSQLAASFALVGLAFLNFISTRNKLLDALFDGLDASYIYHKYLSISVLALILLHDLTIKIGKNVQIASGIHIPKDPYAMYGSFSMYLFVLLIFIALVAKKLNYERWKTIHKFMIIPYAFGIYHYYGSSDYRVFSLTPYTLWMDVLNIIGIASVIYSVFLYERFSFKYKYKITSLNTVANGTLEISGAPIGKTLSFAPGQFAFIKFKNAKTAFPSHPFTISTAPNKNTIQFTIKALGDHTMTLSNSLSLNDEFSVSGPHGRFDYKKGVKNQVWIAGGIGVTPFRSFIQASSMEGYSIEFFYAYTNESEAAYTEELEALTKDSNVNLHLFNSKEKGFLSVAEILKYVDYKNPIDVYFCGPKPMRDSLIKQFNNSKFNVSHFHFEHFQFK